MWFPKIFEKCIQVLIGIWTQLFFEWHTVTFLGIRHNGSINFSRIYFGTHLRFASLEINDTQRTLHHSISPNLAPIQFTWRPLKQVTNSPLVHAPFVMLEMLARFLVSSDMSTSKELQAQKKTVEKENASKSWICIIAKWTHFFTSLEKLILTFSHYLFDLQ